MSKRPRASKAEVKKKIDDIVSHHALGQESYKLPSGLSISEMAERLGCTAAALGKARQFAHPKRGYSESKLQHLCNLLKEHRPVFGTAHVGLLVTAPWPQREELQNDCIENNWSLRELKTARKRQTAPRRRGGRHRQVTVESALVQLEDTTTTWPRLVAGLKRVKDDRPPIMTKLSTKVRARLRDVNTAMKLLRQAVTADLAVVREVS